MIAACGGSGATGGSGAVEGPGATPSGPAQTNDSAASSDPAGPVLRGPATVTVTVGGSTTTIAGGRCDALPEGFVLTVGESGSYPIEPPLPDFFGVTIEGATADGQFTGLAVTLLVVVAEKEYGLDPTGTVTLRNNLSSGDFGGPLALSSDATGQIQGSFDCGT